MNEKPPVNDGNGLYDNIGLIDTLIVDCNELPKLLFEGRNVGFCAKIVEMVQKLTNLRNGVAADKQFLEGEVSSLKQANNEMAEEIFQFQTGGKTGKGDA